MQVNDLKQPSFEAASGFALQVSESVMLVPVGEWVYLQSELIEQMASWRQENMAMFCAKFDSTAAKTLNYLTNASIGQSNRILFLIFESNRMVGHLGLSKITSSTAELDNVMRGSSVQTRALMQLCIARLSSWAREQLGLASLSLQVLDVNQRAIDLYERCGFVKMKNSALMATLVGEVTQFVECEDSRATTQIRSLIMLKEF